MATTAATTPQSSRNPFRTPGVTPNSTGVSTTNSVVSPQSNAQESHSIPTQESNAEANSTSPVAINDAASNDPLGLTEDAPPAYTPTADVYQGEHTIEYGPRRPFQPPPPQPRPPPSPFISPNPTGSGYISPNPTGLTVNSSRPPTLWQQLTGQVRADINTLANPPSTWATQNSSTSPWSSYPGSSPGRIASPQVPQQSSIPSQTSRYAPPPGPPPNHPSSSSRPPVASVSTPVIPSSASATSDFARDFYAAGAATPREVAAATSTSHSSSPSSSPPPSRPKYDPPAGPPPSSPSHHHHHSTPSSPHFTMPPSASSSSLGRSRTTASRSTVRDDGKPTKTPKPGHPLLLNGNLLVYPSGYICDRCHNTGYKEYDPSNPCNKCWSKYAKPYAGPLTYIPWDSPSASSSSSTGPRNKTSYQRPLPDFHSPQSSMHIPRQPGIQRSRSQTQLLTQTLGRRFAQEPLISPSSFSPPLPPHPVPQIQVHQASPFSRPPPGALVLPPGDPRIGGRLCLKCGGRGLVSFMIFEEIECTVCGGVGRVF